MANIRAYFAFYPADWLTDERVRLMTLQQRGLYVELLCYQWREGSLPADPETLAKILGIQPKVFATLWDDRLAGCFSPSSASRLVNPRLENERKRAQKKHRERVSSGRKGGKAKKAKTWQQGTLEGVETPSSAKAQPLPKGKATLKQSESESESPSESALTKRTTSATAVSKADAPWPDDLADVKAQCEKLGVLDHGLDDPAWWRRIDEWLKGSSIGYLDELSAYVAWLDSQNGAKRHKNMKRGFRNWLAKATRWEESRAQTQEFKQRRH